MNFKLPLPAWQSLDDVCRSWKARQQDVLKFAADGRLQMYAFVKPYGPTRFSLEGLSTEWIATTPVVVTPELAGRLIHESYVNVDEWETKAGARWERGFGAYAPQQGLHITMSNLAIFTDELQRFQEEHADHDQPENATSSLSVGLSNSERNKLLRQIGGLALALAEKHGTYRRGTAPNASQIAKSVDEIFVILPDANTYGAGETSIRTSIAEGLNLLKK